MKISKRLVTAAVSMSALAAAISGAEAGGFALREQSASAQGLSFAGAASGSGGLSSMFWNPATVTMKPGWQSEYHASLIDANSDITPLPGTAAYLLPLGPSGDLGDPVILPSSYTSVQLSDQFWIGMSSTTPFGLSTKANHRWAGETYARTTKIASFNINPILGWKVTDWLTIAAGPMIQYAKLDVKRAIAPRVLFGGLEPPNSILEVEDVDVGFTAGVNITPWAGTSLGVGFRSTVHHELDGDLTLSLPRSDRDTLVKVNTPEMLTVGLSQYLGAGVTVHAGYEWTNWSRLKEPAVTFIPSGIPVSSFPLHWEGGHFYSLGLEYAFSPQWTVRAGVAYEESPVTTANRNPRLPDNDRIWASIGLGYKWSEKLSFDVSYSHLFVEDAPIRIVPGHRDFQTFPVVGGAPLIADSEGSVDIVSVSLRYRWDNPAVAVPAAPVVRKF
jgi:long-chain fatty acid transport protein